MDFGDEPSDEDVNQLKSTYVNISKSKYIHCYFYMGLVTSDSYKSILFDALLMPGLNAEKVVVAWKHLNTISNDISGNKLSMEYLNSVNLMLTCYNFNKCLYHGKSCNMVNPSGVDCIKKSEHILMVHQIMNALAKNTNDAKHKKILLSIVRYYENP